MRDTIAMVPTTLYLPEVLWIWVKESYLRIRPLAKRIAEKAKVTTLEMLVMKMKK